jgi:hypothetical protein
MDRIDDRIVNIFMALLYIFGGMIIGMAIIFPLSEIIYSAFFDSGPVEDIYYSCDQKNAIGTLSILSGTLLGLVIGSLGALKYLKSIRRERAESGGSPIVQPETRLTINTASNRSSRSPEPLVMSNSLQ